MSSSYRLELDKWLSELDIVTGHIYDVGGSQLSIIGRVGSLGHKDITTFDLDQPHKDSQKPDVVMDLNTVKSGDISDYFCGGDTIFCLEVFDYVYDPVNAMGALAYMLKPGGRLFVTFPSVYPLHQPVEDDALRYMPGGIEKLADRALLKIVKMTPRRFETRSWEQTIAAERMRGAKHQDHNFSGWIVEFTK